MKRLFSIALTAVLLFLGSRSIGLAAGEPPSSSAPIGIEAIWCPTPQMLQEVHKECDSLAGSKFNDCFVSFMQKEGASPRAVEFTRLIDNDGCLCGYRQAGSVGIAFVTYPFRANENQGVLLVNGNPPVLNVDDFKLLPQKEMKKDALYRGIAGNHPNVSIWPGDRNESSIQVDDKSMANRRRLIFRYRLQDGCHACELLGHADYAFDFDASGKFLGARFLRVEKTASKNVEAVQKMNAEEEVVAESFRVKVGEEFTATLLSNATTGYKWDLASPLKESIVKLAHQQYIAPEQSMRVGAGGKEAWTFRAVGRGKTEIRMKYVRPWEKGVPPARTAVYKVVVE